MLAKSKARINLRAFLFSGSITLLSSSSFLLPNGLSMSFNLEVCIDNLESLQNAISGGATRIELCSSLALGGLTPSYGLMKKAIQYSPIPIYAMIRPRQGDFLYDSADMECMLEDIFTAKSIGLQGVVFGVLKANGDIDIDLATQLINASNGLGITFHRAIDQCSNYQQAIETIAELGCERILTSGLAANAYDGRDIIAKMVKQANGRFSIMAGAGINANNIDDIVASTGVREVHLSGKTTRLSKMTMISDKATMGRSDVDDFRIPITSSEKISLVASRLKSLS